MPQGVVGDILVRMAEQRQSPWKDEAEYMAALTHERHMFAWCLLTVGNASGSEAQSRAELRYPYESATKPYRGIIFHDLAWHYAMSELFGLGYHKARPELGRPSDAYWAESKRFELLADNRNAPDGA